MLIPERTALPAQTVFAGALSARGPVDAARFKKNPLSKSQLDPQTNMSDVKVVPSGKTVVPPKPNLVSFRALFRMTDRTDKWLMGIGVIGSFLDALALPAYLVVMGESFNTLASAEGRVSGSDLDILAVIIAFAAVAVSGMIGFGLENGCWTATSERQTGKLRSLFLKALFSHEMEWFDRKKTGKLLAHLSDDMSLIQNAVGMKQGAMLKTVLGFFLSFAVALYFSWELTLINLSVMPPLIVITLLMGTTVAKMTGKTQNALSEANLVAENAFSAQHTITAFGGQQSFIDRFTRALVPVSKVAIQGSTFVGLTYGGFWLFYFGSYAFGMWYGSTLLQRGLLDGGKIVIVFFCVLAGAGSLGNLGPYVEAVMKARAAAYPIFEILDGAEEITSRQAGEVLQTVTGDIAFQNVSFNYPSRPDVRVLNQISFTVPKGGITAIVGSSGSGKSTIMQLLLKLYQPQNGFITVNGVDLARLDEMWWRRQCAYVSQEPTLFQLSVRDNITLGMEGDVSQEQIETAARTAYAHDFIMKLPDGYNTLVGDRGGQLSAGQKQRIAIARALIRQPRILFLDEATASLDNESERIVQEGIDRLSRVQSLTTLVIAHRLSTIRKANQILFVQNGVVEEKGTHNQLILQGKGFYADMVRLQYGVADLTTTLTSENESHAASVPGDGREPIKDAPVSPVAAHAQDVKTPPQSAESEETPPIPFKRVWHYTKPHWMRLIVASVMGVFQMVVNFSHLANRHCLRYAAFFQGAMWPTFALCFSYLTAAYFVTDFAEMDRLVAFWATAMAITAFVLAASTFLGHRTLTHVGEKTTEQLRIQAYENLLRLHVGYFDHKQHSSGMLVTRLSEDAATVRGSTTTSITSMVSLLGAASTGLGIALYHSPMLTLVIVGIVPILALQQAFLFRFLSRSEKNAQEAYRLAGSTANEAIASIRTVVTLNLQKDVMSLYDGELKTTVRAGLKKARVTGVSTGITRLTIFCIYIVAFAYGNYEIQQGTMSMQTVLVVMYALVFAALSAGISSATAAGKAKLRNATRAIFQLIDSQTEIDPSQQGDRLDPKTAFSLSLSHASFSYPVRPDVPVLRDFSLDLGPGRVIALVGPSGCGKSTIIKLLERFYNLDDGTILLNGKVLSQYDLAWWRQNIGFVPQEPILFDMSIRDNIAFGFGGSDGTSMEEVVNAAVMANAHDFISQFPNGYHTMVGERGSQLSAGQKQRIAIARALIRQPKLLCLDESTSALDTESERVVQEALDKAMRSHPLRTTIIVAHRLSTIRSADMIVVVQEGRVVETGTHEQLLARDEVYASLLRSQFDPEPKSSRSVVAKSSMSKFENDKDVMNL